jgi:hypothetical protein
MILESIENKKTTPRQIKIDGPLIMRG